MPLDLFAMSPFNVKIFAQKAPLMSSIGPACTATGLHLNYTSHIPTTRQSSSLGEIHARQIQSWWIPASFPECWWRGWRWPPWYGFKDTNHDLFYTWSDSQSTWYYWPQEARQCLQKVRISLFACFGALLHCLSRWTESIAHKVKRKQKKKQEHLKRQIWKSVFEPHVRSTSTSDIMVLGSIFFFTKS